MLLNEGKDFYNNRAIGASENAVDTTNGYFLYSNGTDSPALGHDRSDFEGDGTGGNKIVASVTNNTGTHEMIVTGELASTEGNTPGAITKFLLVNDSTTGKAIAEHEFDEVTKNSQVEAYFTLKVKLEDDSE